MPDKKYEELQKRLEKSNRSGGNFRSYERMRQDSRVKHQKDRSAHSSREGEGARPPKKSRKRSGGMRIDLERLAKAVVPVLIGVAAVALLVYALTNKNATEVTLNSEVIGQLETTKTTKEEFVSTLTAKIEQLEDTKIRITDTIELTPVHGSSKLIKDDSQILNLMADMVNYQVLAAEISVDGQPVGVAKNLAEAEAILNALTSPYVTDPETTTVRFVQDVQVSDKYVKPEEITPSDTIRAELSKTSTQKIEYEVVQGDVLSRISALNGMTMAELEEANPGLDVTKPLHIGQKINVISTVPAVSVLTTETKTEIVDIPMDTVEQKDPSLESGQRKIVQQGKAGKKEIVSQVNKINGVKTSEDSISERIVEPAQTQIVSVGG